MFDLSSTVSIGIKLRIHPKSILDYDLFPLKYKQEIENALLIIAFNVQ